MSAEYSVDGILAIAEAADNGDVRHPGMVADMLRAYAERIEADERSVPVAWCSLTPNGQIAHFDGKPMIMPGNVGNEHHPDPLFTHPPAQAAQVDGHLEVALAIEKAKTAKANSPDAADSGRASLCYPARILELEECRKKGWNDSAPAYRAGWNDCCDSVASIIAPHSDVGALTEQADAWNAVVVTLNKVSPGWQFNDVGTGMECACAAIAALAAQGQGELVADPFNYKAMFESAVLVLADIDKLLGLPEDGCNDPQVTVSALADFVVGHKEMQKSRDEWVDAQYASAAAALPAGVPEVPLPMDTAPRDGRMLRLLVDFDEHATEDTPYPAWTIGANNFDGDGDDEWLFAGWCWEHDHFTQGKGTPVGWLPMLAAAPSAPEGGEVGL